MILAGILPQARANFNWVGGESLLELRFAKDGECHGKDFLRTGGALSSSEAVISHAESTKWVYYPELQSVGQTCDM